VNDFHIVSRGDDAGPNVATAWKFLAAEFFSAVNDFTAFALFDAACISRPHVGDERSSGCSFGECQWPAGKPRRGLALGANRLVNDDPARGGQLPACDGRTESRDSEDPGPRWGNDDGIVATELEDRATQSCQTLRRRDSHFVEPVAEISGTRGR
jgi:hypothetical protein